MASQDDDSYYLTWCEKVLEGVARIIVEMKVEKWDVINSKALSAI